MQIVLKDRVNVVATQTFYTPPIDLQGVSAVSLSLVAHAISGTSASVAAQLQAADSLEDADFGDLGSGVQVTATGMESELLSLANGDVLLRYVRVAIVTAGTNFEANYSVVINTFQST
jgi:hypothetical protein